MSVENEESVEEIVAKGLPLIFESAQEALDCRVTLGLENKGPTKYPMPSPEDQRKRLEIIPKGQHEGAIRIWKRLAERGIERHEFVQPGNHFMSMAFQPLSEDFFALRERAGEEVHSPKTRTKFASSSLASSVRGNRFPTGFPRRSAIPRQ